MGEIGDNPKKPGRGYSKDEKFSGRQRVKLSDGLIVIYYY